MSVLMCRCGGPGSREHPLSNHVTTGFTTANVVPWVTNQYGQVPPTVIKCQHDTASSIKSKELECIYRCIFETYGLFIFHMQAPTDEIKERLDKQIVSLVDLLNSISANSNVATDIIHSTVAREEMMDTLRSLAEEVHPSVPANDKRALLDRYIDSISKSIDRYAKITRM